MTLGDAAEPLGHIQDFRVDFRYGSIEYGKKLSIAGTFRRKELAAK
ncbi:hypothetical protein [Arthrobacter sp. Z4-13]|jgi:hypothetical protein